MSAFASPYKSFHLVQLFNPTTQNRNKKKKLFIIKSALSIMNSMFDSSSPLEALVLNYSSFGVFNVVNNLWTWVAVLTAAISYWRIRTTSFSDKLNHHHHQPRSIDTKSTSGSRTQPSANKCVKPEAPSPSPSPSPSPRPAHISALPSVNDMKEADGIIEGSKYTMYYYDEEEEDERESDGYGDGELTVVKEWRDDYDNGVSSGEGWERARIRGDLGWYGYQDLTVINGNVVRLWEECRRRSEKRFRCGCGCSSCCAVWCLDN